jgi:predicted metal-dependent hydrolase
VSAVRGEAQLPLFEPSAGVGEFRVRVSPRSRRLTVRVYPGGRVEVAVPRGTRPRAIERFVSRNRPWIEARIAELASHPRAHEPPLPPDIRLEALGRTTPVRYLGRPRPGWRLAADGALEVYGDAAHVGRTRQTLRSWLTATARDALEPWLRALAGAHGFRIEQVQLRRQHTRWGSCSRTGTVSLNVCLLFQPQSVVRYLMLHELCHTRHMNHSDRFWRLVADYEPDYRALDRQLTRGWQHVPTWVYG